jgi:broad specificity phosphatase PhoE
MTRAAPGRPEVAIILVRHAPTAWTGRRYCGRSDPPLDVAGEMAAARLAGELAPALALGMRIVTSPSVRALATATAIAATAGTAPPIVDDRWREADFGIAEGLTFEELERLAPGLARRLADGETEIDWPDGERATELTDRVTAAWHDLGEIGDVVVVSHAGPLRIAIGLATSVPPGAVELPAPGGVIRLPVAVRS